MSETPVFCPKCGVSNHPMNYRCQSCGTVLPQQQAPQTPPPQQPNPYQNPYQQAPGQYGQNPYYSERPAPPFPKPNNGLVGAILSTVLCGCLPLGIVAIVNASKVDSAWAEGRWDDAARFAKNAQTFTWVSVAVGVVVGILYFLVLVAAEGR